MIWEATIGWRSRAMYIDLARRAVALRPDVGLNWEGLSDQLLSLARYEEAIEVLNEGVASLPENVSLHLMLAAAYRRSGRMDLALAALERAPSVRPDDRRNQVRRLEVLMRAPEAKSQMASVGQLLDLDPTNVQGLMFLASVQRKAGRFETIIQRCRAALLSEPGHSCARYELAVALACSGELDEARALIDTQAFTTVTDVPTPEGYADAGAFEAALAAEIQSDPTLKPDPPEKATKGGFQTISGLPYSSGGAMSRLIDSIKITVESNLPETVEDSYLKARPKRVSLDAWAVVYPGDGRQISHIHNSGWLSGVYYVSAPPSPLDDDMQSGCLQLGALEMNGSNPEPPWEVRNIRPEPGRLVLFPSYIPHATRPTKARDLRICVAFDVMPVREIDALTGGSDA